MSETLPMQPVGPVAAPKPKGAVLLWLGGFLVVGGIVLGVLLVVGGIRSIGNRSPFGFAGRRNTADPTS